VGEIFRTRTDRTWGPPTSYYEYRVYFAVGKRPGSGVVHPPPSSDEVKERVLLRLYSPLGLNGMFQGELVGRESGRRVALSTQPPTPSSDEVKERVLLRLYSSLGLYAMLQGELVGG
jgi:hypothetical protein